MANIITVWKDIIFAHIPESDRDKPLTAKALDNPKHPATVLILYLYTLDNFLFVELNKGSKEGDTAKIDTLGAYATAFGYILANAA